MACLGAEAHSGAWLFKNFIYFWLGLHCCIWAFFSCGDAKECLNYCTTALISHASKVLQAQNSPSQASAICEPWTSRYSSWFKERQRNQRANCQPLLDHGKSKRVPEKHLFLFYWLCQSFWLCGSQTAIGSYISIITWSVNGLNAPTKRHGLAEQMKMCMYAPPLTTSLCLTPPPKLYVILTVKGFGIVNKTEIDVFLEVCCFFHDPADVGNLTSGSSAFSKTSLNIRKFTVHVLLKPGLENFEHYLLACEMSAILQ